MKRVEQF